MHIRPRRDEIPRALAASPSLWSRASTWMVAPATRRPGGWQGFVVALIVVAVATVVSLVVLGRELADVAMTYLLGIVIVAMRFGFRASIFAAILSVLSFDFFITPPYLT